MNNYNLNQVSMITGFTTRTLRNHIKQGILSGEKIDGNWAFTEEELDKYLNDASIIEKTMSSQHSLAFDFLSDPFKTSNRICTIMDFPVSDGEALSIAKFFCDLISERGTDVQFRYINEKHFARFILSGSEEQVAEFMKEYYDK